MWRHMERTDTNRSRAYPNFFLDLSLISRFSFERIVNSFTFDNEKQDEEIRTVDRTSK